MNDWLMPINSIGETFWQYSSQIFIQSSILIALLLVIDFLLRKRIRATLRYWIWMLVFIKLILPPTLSLPTGVGYWLHGRLIATLEISEDLPATSNLEPTAVSATEIPMPAVETALIPSQETILEPVAPTTIVITRPTWKGIVFLLWLCGISALSILLLKRIRFARRLIAESTPAEQILLETLNQCRNELGITRSIQLRLSTGTPSPAACGLLKPVILMPAALPDKLPPERLKAVLIHELAHIKRHDLWINSAQTLLQIIYFYNPLLWLSNAVVRRVREQAVDEMVLATLGAEAKDYSNTLIDIAEMAFFKPSLSLRLIGVVESKKALQGRIKLMLNRPVPKKTKLGIFGFVIIFTIAAILLPMARAEKETQKPTRLQNITTSPELNTVAVDKFAATLSNDVTLKLLGVCEHPSVGKKWWQPDGNDLPEAPYRTFNNSVHAKEGEQAREIALRLIGPQQLVNNAAVQWKIPDASYNSGNIHDRDKDGNQIMYIRATAVRCTAQRKTLDFKVGVAGGTWKTVRVLPPKEEQPMIPSMIAK